MTNFSINNKNIVDKLRVFINKLTELELMNSGIF